MGCELIRLVVRERERGIGRFVIDFRCSFFFYLYCYLQHHPVILAFFSIRGFLDFFFNSSVGKYSSRVYLIDTITFKFILRK